MGKSLLKKNQKSTILTQHTKWKLVLRIKFDILIACIKRSCFKELKYTKIRILFFKEYKVL